MKYQNEYQASAPPYYRIYLQEYTKNLTIVSSRDLDNYGFDENKLWVDKHTGIPVTFKSLIDAKKWLNENIKQDKIDPNYLDEWMSSEWQDEYLKSGL